jgi:hypothetical protein
MAGSGFLQLHAFCGELKARFRQVNGYGIIGFTLVMCLGRLLVRRV